MPVNGPTPGPGCIRHNAARPGELLTVVDTADRGSVPGRFIRRLVAERRIRFHKIGRQVCIHDHHGDIDAHHDELPGSREGSYRPGTPSQLPQDSR